MKRARKAVILLLTAAVAMLALATVAASGCGLFGARPPAEAKPGDVTVDPGTGPGPAASASDEEQAWISGHTNAAGVFVKKFGDTRLVLITAGEKPTGGYAVEIASATETDQEWLIDVVFRSPGPSDIVTQVLTYPYQFCRIKDDGKTIRVRDVTSGEAVEMQVTGE